MVAAFLLTLLLPAAASAQIRTAAPDEKRIILEHIARGLKGAQDMTDLHNEAHAAREQGNEDAFVLLMSRALMAKSAMHDNLNLAIEKTQDLYHVGPEVGGGDHTVANGPLAGNTLSFFPDFVPETEESDRDREKRAKKRNPGGGGSRPPSGGSDKDYEWNADCNCWIRRY